MLVTVLGSCIAACIGGQNIEFVTKYLEVEKIKVVKNDTAGNNARKVYYIPATGDVFLKRITKTNNDTIELREKEYMDEAKHARTTA